jgi:hypothetical protein
MQRFINVLSGIIGVLGVAGVGFVLAAAFYESASAPQLSRGDKIKAECARQFPYDQGLANDCAIQAMARVILEDRRNRYEAGYNAGR